MTCDTAQRLASDALDESLPAPVAQALEEHTRSCADCQTFRTDLHALRQRLRLQPVTVAPDVVSDVVAQLHDRPAQPPVANIWADRLRQAAVFLLAIVTGAVTAGVAGPPVVRAEPLGQRLLDAQGTITTLSAEVRITEFGWHTDVPRRRYSGTVAYRAPESISMRLRDTTSYPSDQWDANHVAIGVFEGQAWSTGLRSCPRALQPQCSTAAETSVLRGRAPFDPATAVPGDLVMPVNSLGEHSAPRLLGQRTVDGETLVGVAVTAAQLEPLLEGITRAGNWRAVHPSDPATVWLDDRSLTLRSVEITAAGDSERQRWAASENYSDKPGSPVLTLELAQVRTNDGVPADRFDVPQPSAADVDGRFRNGPAADVPTPGWLPEGLTPHRRGAQANSQIASWSDGRSWLRIAVTDNWQGDRLYGDLGDVVRPVTLDQVGRVYVGQAAIGIHGDGFDLAITGSFDEATLLRVADGLDVAGLPAPRHWRDHASVSAATLSTQFPNLLRPGDLPGFAPPAARVEGDTVTMALAGPGARSFVVVQRPGRSLSPPLDAHVIGVLVRERIGRFTPSRGELEWVENRHTVLLRSATLGLPELLDIAAGMRSP